MICQERINYSNICSIISKCSSQVRIISKEMGGDSKQKKTSHGKPSKQSHHKKPSKASLNSEKPSKQSSVNKTSKKKSHEKKLSKPNSKILQAAPA